jgi:hypothetical protein
MVHNDIIKTPLAMFSGNTLQGGVLEPKELLTEHLGEHYQQVFETCRTKFCSFRSCEERSRLSHPTSERMGCLIKLQIANLVSQKLSISFS